MRPLEETGGSAKIALLLPSAYRTRSCKRRIFRRISDLLCFLPGWQVAAIAAISSFSLTCTNGQITFCIIFRHVVSTVKLKLCRRCSEHLTCKPFDYIPSTSTAAVSRAFVSFCIATEQSNCYYRPRRRWGSQTSRHDCNTAEALVGRSFWRVDGETTPSFAGRDGRVAPAGSGSGDRSLMLPLKRFVA